MSDQKYNYWLKSGTYNGLQKGSVLVFGMASIMLLTRTLTIADMGVWNLFLVYTGIIEMIRQSLIKNAVIKNLNSEPKADHPQIQSAALYINIVVTFILILAIAVLAIPMGNWLKAPSLTMVMYYFIPGLVLLIPFSHFEWVQNANSDFKGIFFAYVARQSTALGCIVVHLLIVKSVSLLALIIYFDAGLLSGTIVSGLFARKFLYRTGRATKEWLGRLWSFGKYVFGTNISSQVFRNTDQNVISSLLGPAAMAPYSVCLRISNMIDLPSQVLGDILFPRTAKMMEDGNLGRVKYYYEKAVGSILAVAVPASLFVFIFPHLTLLVTGGKKYLDAAPILQITVIYGLFLPFIKQFGTIMDSTGYPKLNFLVITVTALVNIASCYYFTRYFGTIGAAYGTMTSYGICLLITQTILYRKLRVNFPNIFRYMFSFYPEMLQLAGQRVLKLRVR